MHVKWRGLELPASVDLDPASSTSGFGRFTAEPFERGFGTTIGNSIRRVLLGSIEGSAITKVKIAGVDHEFTTIHGMKEDVVDLLMNIKGLVVDSESDAPEVITLKASGPGEVTGAHIECVNGVEVVNPDHNLATLTEDIELNIEMTVERGRGYQPASEMIEKSTEESLLPGDIPIDAVFSPILRVRYRVENTRVGQKTNYDRLILDLWTDGTIEPQMAMVEAGKILRKHLNPFVQYNSIGDKRISEVAARTAQLDEEFMRQLEMPIAQLGLTVRSNNCLEAAGVLRVCDLVVQQEHELLKLRSFGRTSLREIRRKLEELSLDLGMTLPEGFEPHQMAAEAMEDQE